MGNSTKNSIRFILFGMAYFAAAVFFWIGMIYVSGYMVKACGVRPVLQLIDAGPGDR